MRNRGLYHVGIAVKGLSDALPFWRDVLGLPFRSEEDLPDRGLKAAMLDASGCEVELLASTREDSVIAKYVAKRGPGVHHLAFEVADIDAALAELKKRGVKLVDEVARPGATHTRVAFLHPSACGGVLVELVERPKRSLPNPKCRDLHAEWDKLAGGAIQEGELPAWMNVRGPCAWYVHQGPYETMGQAWAVFMAKASASYAGRMAGPPGDVYVCDPMDHENDASKLTTILFAPIR